MTVLTKHKVRYPSNRRIGLNPQDFQKGGKYYSPPRVPVKPADVFRRVHPGPAFGRGPARTNTYSIIENGGGAARRIPFIMAAVYAFDLVDRNLYPNFDGDITPSIPPYYNWCTGPNDCPTPSNFASQVTGKFFSNGGNCSTSGGCLSNQAGIGFGVMTPGQATSNLVALYMTTQGNVRAQVFGAVQRVGAFNNSYVIAQRHLTQNEMPVPQVALDLLPFGPTVMPVPWPFQLLPYRKPNGDRAPSERTEWGHDTLAVPEQVSTPRFPNRVVRHVIDTGTAVPSPDFGTTIIQTFTDGPGGPPHTVVEPPRTQPPRRDPDGKREDERKTKARSRAGRLIQQALQVTEYKDIVDAIWKKGFSYDKKKEFWRKYGKLNLVQRNALIFRHFGDVDIAAAIQAVVENQAQDAVIGGLNRGTGRLRDQGVLTSTRLPTF